MTEAYPLQWPHGRPRKGAHQRKAAPFNKGRTVYRGGMAPYTVREDLSVADALKRLLGELDRLGARNVVVSSNVELRQDGLPRSSANQNPRDPGVAVYFQLSDKKPLCLPCDTYHRVADNLAAVAKHIEATRAIERYGVATIAEQFTGFAALPKPGGADWWEVLKLTRAATKEQIEESFRALARERHPDRGGSEHQMAELNGARAAALREKGAT